MTSTVANPPYPTTTPAQTPSSNLSDDTFTRVVQGAHQTIDRIAETAEPHVRHLQEGVASAKESLHHRSDEVRELGTEWTESLRDTVRMHPLASVVAALAVGVLVARLAR